MALREISRIPRAEPESVLYAPARLTLGESITGGDVGPILGAVKDIKAGNMISFSEVFYKLANDPKA
ncbi:hypothetical protein N7463_001386 [Penicillium fimorum]|uniref:Uncharacterized protein n=1 Tax=Penicillium fimorum TaxID=1882269 RepID=A0A9X0CD45_9EURO|nr:hypothetical protein N7463_001386 [Penicillium fimorum]